MKFVKMEGLGNDFVIVDANTTIDAELVQRLCDRHFGIGADGVLRVGRDDGVVSMEYWNADGGESEMCGNGLRCVAQYAYDQGLVANKNFVVRTASGRRRVEVGDEVRVELGPVTLGEDRLFDQRLFHRVSVGNPHLVSLGENPDLIDVPGIGAALEQSVPGGVNVGFGATTPSGLRLRVWERGVGETLACGSGMVAAAAVAQRLGIVDRLVSVQVRGGTATVEIEDDTTWLSGPARAVFSGEFITTSE